MNLRHNYILENICIPYHNKLSIHYDMVGEKGGSRQMVCQRGVWRKGVQMERSGRGKDDIPEVCRFLTYYHDVHSYIVPAHRLQQPLALDSLYWSSIFFHCLACLSVYLDNATQKSPETRPSWIALSPPHPQPLVNLWLEQYSFWSWKRGLGSTTVN